jgi:Rieske Fe-S protein
VDATSRRGFLRIVGSAAVGCASGCWQDVDVLSEDVEIDLAEHAELAEVDRTVKIDVGLRRPIAVTRLADTEFLVTGTECTHQNCEVNRVNDEWHCPCHGSRFALDGDLEEGPAKRGLTVYDWELDEAAGVLTVLGR